jgi:anti-anti-sigma factor
LNLLSFLSSKTEEGLNMQINTRESYEVLVVDIEGRLDTSTSGYGYDEMVRIAKGGNKKILVNLKELEYVSSAGLRVLLTAAKLVQALGGQIKFCQPNDLVKQVLEISGFNSLLSVYGGEGEAIKSF